MKRTALDIESVKQKIIALKGLEVKLSINRGRKRFEKLKAKIECVYPSVFTVSVDTHKFMTNQTFSYTDILCGDVIID